MVSFILLMLLVQMFTVKVASGEDQKPGNQILTSSTDVNNPILTSSTDVSNPILTSSADVNNPILSSLTDVSNPVLTSSTDVTGLIQTSSTDVNNLNLTSDDSNKPILTSSANITDLFLTSSTDVSDPILTSSSDINDLIQTPSTNVNDTILTSSTDIIDLIQTSSTDVNNPILTSSTDIKDSILTLPTDVNSPIWTSSTDANDLILTSSIDVDNPILTSSTDIKDTILTSSTDVNDPFLTSPTDVIDIIQAPSTEVTAPTGIFITEVYVPFTNPSTDVTDPIPDLVIATMPPGSEEETVTNDGGTLRTSTLPKTTLSESTFPKSTLPEATIAAIARGEDEKDHKEFWTESKKWKNQLESEGLIVDDYYVLDNLVMPLNYYELLFKGKKPEKMKADSYLWPEDLYTGKPLLPYEISVSDQTTIDLVREAIEEWNSATCIDFVEMTEGNYKRFAHQENLVIRNDTVCLFGFGRQEGIRQILLLGPPCLNKEEIVRGIGVNLGLLYQVLRRDRDEYITIHYDNFQWPKQPTDQWHHHSTPYDFSSVMQHHGMWETENSLLTLTTNDIRYQGILGRSRGKLSHRDKKTVNELYGCIRSWRVFCGFRSNPCFNEGYVGSDCNCVCRTGTEGAYCEHVLDDDYYGHLLSPCSQHIDKNSTIESPLYIVKIVMPDTWCVWTIKAPKGQLIALDFTFFQLNTTEDCQDSFLEIREKNMSNGTVFCGNSLADEIYVSDENELSVYLDVRNNISQGFHADVVLFDPEILKLGSSPGSRLQLPPVLFILLCISITLLP